MTTLTPSRRFREKARQRRWRRVTGPLVVLLVLVVLVALGGFLLADTSLVSVRRIQVVGATTIPADQVRHAAKVRSGTPLLRVNTGTVRSRVRGLPVVAWASVSTRWPSTLRIEVRERQPVIAVTTGDPHKHPAVHLIDATGLAYRTVSSLPAGVVPADLAKAGPGDPVTMAVIAVVRALPATVRAQITTVSAPTPAQVTLHLTNNRTVNWGDADDPARKATVLTTLLQQKGTWYDVSAPDVVTVK
jgi:cell division protein FtsQ